MQRLNTLHNQLILNKASLQNDWSQYKDSAANHEKYKDIIEKYLPEIKMKSPPSFATKAIHVGSEPDPIHGQVTVPISLSTTFAQKSPGELFSKYVYTSDGNPTREALERCMASLDYADYCIALSSGSSAIASILFLLNSGDHALAFNSVYAGVQRYFRSVSTERHDIAFDYVDFTDLNAVKAAIKKNTKLFWIESPSNPTFRFCDIRKICQIAREHGIITVVDNTLSTPFLQNPLLLGADVALYSCSKFIGGHSDLLLGALCLNDKELYQKLLFITQTTGPSPSPFDCYTAIRSLKTLKIRMEAAVKNAYVIAHFLNAHPKVAKVLYPGLKSHPQHELAKEQLRGPGAMLSICVKGGLKESIMFIQNLKVFTLAESCGAVESLILSTELMSYHALPVEERRKLGLDENLVRMSVGIEDLGDLINDLDQSLNLL